MRNVFAIDLGGTTVKFSIVNEEGTIRDQWSIPTDTSDSGSNIPRDIVQSLSEKMTSFPEPIMAIGAGIPGPICGDTATRAVNLGWENMPLGSLLTEMMHMPTTLLNDANAAALGEAWKGGDPVATGGNAVFITLGTGVGGGIIVDGRVINGEHGCAGEIGHFPILVPGEERTCGCGNTNCLETFTSATGLINTANKLLGEAGDSRRVSSGKEVFDLVAAGDPVAIAARDQMVDTLARGLAIIMSTVDPREVIVGGGLSHAGAALLQPLAERLEHYVFPMLRGNYVLRCATLGNDAGILGAAYQAFQLLDGKL